MPGKENIKILGWLTVIFITLLLMWGYSYGHNNSIQLIPYAQYLNDNSLFPNDFFIQNAIRNTPNERTFFIFLIQPFGAAMEWVVFIEYCVFMLFLLFALFKIAQYLLKNNLYAYASIILLFFPLLFHTLGLNELHSSEFSSTLTSDTFSAWAILAWLHGKNVRTYIFLIISTLFHPLAGFQVFLLISGTLFISAIQFRTLPTFFKNTFPLILGYVFTAGLYLYSLNNRLNDVPFDSADFFRIFFVFRNAHHYIPSQFVLKDIIILTPLYLLTPILIYKHNKKVFLMSLIILIGCLFYTIGVEVFNSPQVAVAQWFKTTIWLEFFGVIAALLFIRQLIPLLDEEKRVKQFFVFIILICAGWSLFVFPGLDVLKTQIAYEFPFYKKMTPEIDISIQAGKLTPKDALFIQPCAIDELKSYGQRSSYVDYKALTHSKSFIKEWAVRFEEVYGVNALTSVEISFDAVAQADKNFLTITEDDLEKLNTEKGITHIIMPNETALPYKVITRNAEYTIYEL